MIGVLLAGASSALREVSDSIGKKEVQDRVVSYYTFGFLNLLFGTSFLIAYGFLFHDLVFTVASLPTFLPRVCLEILQAHLTVLAVTTADRGNFGFVKTLTIPLLLGADIVLGYAVSGMQMLGIGIILAAVLFLVITEGRHMKGRWFLIASAVNAAITLSLFKYDITNFNSVAAEQSIIMSILMLYFFLCAFIICRENPFAFLRRRIFVVQTTSSGLSEALSSFAYSFAPAAVITTGLRATAILFAMLSGKLYFHEKGFLLKVGLFCLIVLGLIFLALGS